MSNIYELEQKYANFSAPAFQILVEGTDIVKSDGVAVSRVRVETTMEPKADSFYFVVDNAFDLETREIVWLDKYFTPGKYVEIKLGYLDRLETVFYGVITGFRFYYTDDGAISLTVMGMDKSFLMMQRVRYNYWNNKKHSDVAREIGSSYGINCEVDDTGETINTIVQNGMEDYHFLSSLANENNYDFHIFNQTMYFRKKLKDREPEITLSLGGSLRSFSMEVNIANQINEVIVRGWVEGKSEVVEGRSTRVNILGPNTKTGKDILKTLGGYTRFVYSNVNSMEEAKNKANAMLNNSSMDLIAGDGEAVGLPLLRAGKYVKLENIGKIFSQVLYLKAVTHILDSSGYKTLFSVGGNAI